MRRMFTDELRCLEVINLCGGERLGFPCEIEIDLNCGNIISFTVIPDNKCFSFFGEKNEYIIPWSKIECIGEDAILIRLKDGELCPFNRSKNRKKRK